MGNYTLVSNPPEVFYTKVFWKFCFTKNWTFLIGNASKEFC